MELAWIKLRSGEPDLTVEYARRAHELSRRNVEYPNSLGVGLRLPLCAPACMLRRT